jgi:Icc protein
MIVRIGKGSSFMSSTFLHLSDLHLVRPGERASEIDSRQNLSAVLAYLKERAIRPSFVVISGDLSNDGSAESYAVLMEALPEIAAADTPVLLALGNHDDRSSFRRVVLGEEAGGALPYHYSHTIDGLRVIVLDSMIPGEDGGALGGAQLAWLEKELEAPAARGNLLVLHHCCRLASRFTEEPDFILRDAAELEAVVACHQERIVGVLAGHSHQANAATFGGTVHVTAPAVFCQLDFFQGDRYLPVPGSGFNLCQIRDGQLTVVPVMI